MKEDDPFLGFSSVHITRINYICPELTVQITYEKGTQVNQIELSLYEAQEIGFIDGNKLIKALKL